MSITYNDAIKYITNALQFGINPGLEKIEAICKELSEPQLRYPTIQITGTNGKTSTTWMLRKLLTATGSKTGCYTSPHLHSYRERISIDGELISEESFASSLEAIMPAVEKVKASFGDLTEFEILTAMAFYYFAAQGVDVAVFEVGLGGRWDATSVTRPKVSVITGISLDHTDRLGDSVEKIAWDKAHIIKSGSSAVVGMIPEGALEVIKERCQEVGAGLKVFGRDFLPKDVSIVKNEGSRFSISGIFEAYEAIELPVFGIYQVLNFSTAVAALETFRGEELDIGVLQSAVKEISCPGRFEVVRHDPLIVLDGAHNPEGIQMVVEGLPQSFQYRNLVAVLAVSSDKEIEKMLNILAKHASVMVLSENYSYRSASASELTDIARSTGNSYIIEPDLAKAIQTAVLKAAPDDLVCVTGSLYTVAEAREILLKN